MGLVGIFSPPSFFHSLVSPNTTANTPKRVSAGPVTNPSFFERMATPKNQRQNTPKKTVKPQNATTPTTPKIKQNLYRTATPAKANKPVRLSFTGRTEERKNRVASNSNDKAEKVIGSKSDNVFKKVDNRPGYMRSIKRRSGGTIFSGGETGQTGGKPMIKTTRSGLKWGFNDYLLV